MPPSQLSLEQQLRAQGLLSKAQMMMDEQLDDVKKMNEMVLYSKVVTIRDKQIEENKQLEREFIEEQKKLDLMMEIERLKSLHEEEKRERRKVAAAYHGKQVLIDQIQERALIRQKESEIVDREREALKAHQRKIDEEEVKVMTAKKEKAKKILVEIEHANEISRAMKEKKRIKEVEQDAEIFRHIQQKQQAELERQEMERRIKEEKEREVQKLREMQEKAADRQADIDALRAKRAFEDRERELRGVEKQEYYKKIRLLVDLEESRKEQFIQK